MQIKYKIQTDTTRNNNDMRVITWVRIGLAVAILISAATNFMGFEEWSSDYFITTSWFWKNAALFGAFLLLCFLPDSVLSNFVRYGTAQIYDGEVASVSSGIIMVFIVAICSGLAIYSFRLSKNSGELKATEISGDAEVQDIALIDSSFFDQQQQIDSKRLMVDEKARARVQNQLSALLLPIESDIERHTASIASLERNRNEGNTQWTDKRQNSYRRRITALNKKLASLTNQYELIADSVARQEISRYDETLGLLASSYQENRDSTVVYNRGKGEIHMRISGVFISTLRGLSGWAVIIVIILSIVLEVLYKRNGIEPAPIFEAFDFQPSPVIEVLKLPFVYIGRGILNAVRRKYNELERPVIRTDSLYHDVPDVMQVLREFDAKILAESNGNTPLTAASNTASSAAKAENGGPLLTAAVNGQIKTKKKPCKNGRCKPMNSRKVNGELEITGEEKVAVKIVERAPTIECLHCGKESEKTVWNKKFCDDGCKRQHHAKKHNGVPYDPQFVFKN